jgi:predicted DCC family thiol-disulfide oxidoreductase YuxK
MQKDTLYYDGACPLCRAEIGKLEKFSGDRIQLKDVHRLDADETTVDKSELLSRLHLHTADGQWITGLKANIRAWQHTPFAGLWRMLDWPLINRISYPCYELWLRRRAAARLSCNPRS